MSSALAGQSATTTAVSSNESVTFNSAEQFVVIDATVTSGAGTVNEGIVTFAIVDIGTTPFTPIGNAVPVTVSAGVAVANYVLPGNTLAKFPTTYSIVATYSDSAGTNFLDSSDNSKTLRVLPADTSTVAADAAAGFSPADQDVTLSATVSAAGGQIVNEGFLFFRILGVGAEEIVQRGVVSGSAYVRYTIPGGTPINDYTIEVFYSEVGTSNYATSSDTATLTIGKTLTATRTVEAAVHFNASPQSVTFSARVTSPSGTVNEGKVQFQVVTSLNGGLPIGDPVTSSAVSNGMVSVTYLVPGNTPGGIYPIQADYSGTDTLAPSSDSTGTLSIERDQTVTMSGNYIVSYSLSPQSISMSATVSALFGQGSVNEGTVTFTVSDGFNAIGVPVTSDIVVDGDASAIFQLPGGTAPSSNYLIVAAYSGGDSFGPSKFATARLTVLEGGSEITVSDAFANYSDAAQTVQLVAAVTSGGAPVNEGTVQFLVKEIGGAATLIGSATIGAVVSGSAVVNYTLPGKTAAKTYSIQASFDGGTSFNFDKDNSRTLTVFPVSTTTAALNTSTPAKTVDQIVTLHATVTSLNGVVNGGTVTFTVKVQGGAPVNNPVTSSAVVSGGASVEYTLPANLARDTYTIVATYNGSGNFGGSTDSAHTLVVTDYSSSTFVFNNATAPFSATAQPVTLSATVTSSSGQVNVGNVVFKVLTNGHLVGNAQSSAVVSGSASVIYTIPGGTAQGFYTISAAYDSDGNSIAPSSDISKILIIRFFSSTTASNASMAFGAGNQPVTLRANVLSAGGIVNEGTVQFQVSGNSGPVGVTKSAVVLSGIASVNFIVFGGTPTGDYTIQATFSGGSTFSTSSSSATLTIAQFNSATSPDAASVFASSSDQPVSLHAAVTSNTGGVVDTGSVVFQITSNGLPVGSAMTSMVVSGNVSASYTVPHGTPAGSYTIEATYSDGGKFAGSFGTNTLTIISTVTTTTTTSNVAALFSASSQQVTMTATITASNLAVVNEGFVTFTVLDVDGVTVIGGSPVQSGQITAGSASASYFLPGGTAVNVYTIHAEYSGGPHFPPSSDLLKTLTVRLDSAPVINSPPIATPASASAGESVTFTVAATDPDAGDTLTLTFIWAFDDGTPNASGPSVTHTFVTAGSHVATVTITDALGKFVTASVTVTVTAKAALYVTGNPNDAGDDTDTDGFSDQFEKAVNASLAGAADPNDGGKTPYDNNGKATAPQALVVKSLSIKLNFLASLKDGIQLKGSLPIAAGALPLTGHKVVVDVGGFIAAFKLDAKGKSPKSTTSSFTIGAKPNKKTGLSTYSFKVSKSTLASFFADDGMTVSAAANTPVNIPVTILFTDAGFQKAQALHFTQSKGTTGKTRP